jgi:flagellar motility protein MotE (MotC chaperone)
MGILQSLLKSIELFLSLKNKLFYYDIREKSKKRQNEIIDEIEKLRSRGDSNSADRADLLRSELSREKSELEHLSTFYSKASERSKDSNN